MIRLTCPKCRKSLNVADTHAGKVGACPHCHSKIRVPSIEVEPDIIEDVPKAPSSSVSKHVRSTPSAKPRRKEEYEEVEEVVEEVEPDEEAPPPRSRRGADEDEGERAPRRKRARDEEDEDEPPRRKRSGKRRKQSGASAGMSPSLMWGLILGGVCLATSIPAIFVPALSLLPIGLGYLASLIGGIWFLAVAFRDDVMQGILCLFIPFYSLYYLITHFDEEKMPFFTQLAGMGMIMIGGCAGAAGATQFG